MKIVAISGSARPGSSNTKLLKQIDRISEDFNIKLSLLVEDLPMFKYEQSDSDLSPKVKAWRTELANAEGVIICIPEYIHNMPALIKNSLEWIASSGELVGKMVLAITFTPHAPRGEKAMQSLLWSLQALDANVLASLPIYKTDIEYNSKGDIIGETREILNEALLLFNP